MVVRNVSSAKYLHFTGNLLAVSCKNKWTTTKYSLCFVLCCQSKGQAVVLNSVIYANRHICIRKDTAVTLGSNCRKMETLVQFYLLIW